MFSYMITLLYLLTIQMELIPIFLINANHDHFVLNWRVEFEGRYDVLHCSCNENGRGYEKGPTVGHRECNGQMIQVSGLTACQSKLV